MSTVVGSAGCRVRLSLPALACAAVAFGSAASRAEVVDLSSAGAFGTINGAIFSTSTEHAGGSGVVNPFLRINRQGIQSGYNTTLPAGMYGRNEVANFTRDLRLNQVGTVNSGGTDYYQFFLDINEPAAASARKLSLDDLRIYTSPTAHGDYKLELNDLGTLRYSMDVGENNRVDLDRTANPQLQGPGAQSGTGDMVLLVPAALFAGVGGDSFVYLYSRFGDQHAADGKAEEWWTRNPELIPLPAGLWLGLCGLGGIAGLGALRRRSMVDEG